MLHKSLLKEGVHLAGPYHLTCMHVKNDDEDDDDDVSCEFYGRFLKILCWRLTLFVQGTYVAVMLVMFILILNSAIITSTFVPWTSELDLQPVPRKQPWYSSRTA